MVAVPSLENPIFIVGTVRSGTTLLARCLGEHPVVQWVWDSGLELAETWFSSSRVSLGVPGLPCQHCPPAGFDSLSPARAEGVRQAFARLLRDGASTGKERFLCKNPHLWNKLELLRSIFPDARVIITSRDIRSTVLSTQFLWMRLHKQHDVLHYLPHLQNHCWSCLPKEQADQYDPARTFPGGDVTVLAEYWLRAYETIDATIGRFIDSLLVRHRDLIDSPRETLAAVHRRIGVSQFCQPVDTEFDTGRNDRWRRLLTESEQGRLNEWIERHRDRVARLKYADITL